MKEFKLIVAGGRDFNDFELLSIHLNKFADDIGINTGVSIVSGMAKGADALAVKFAQMHDVKLYEFPADWNTYGKRAGFIRNEEMGKFADGLLAFWNGKSSGTKHMIHCMQSLNKPTFVMHY